MALAKIQTVNSGILVIIKKRTEKTVLRPHLLRMSYLHVLNHAYRYERVIFFDLFEGFNARACNFDKVGRLGPAYGVADNLEDLLVVENRERLVSRGEVEDFTVSAFKGHAAAEYVAAFIP